MHRHFIALLLAIASSLAAAPVMAAGASDNAHLYNLGGLAAEALVIFLVYQGAFTVYAR